MLSTLSSRFCFLIYQPRRSTSFGLTSYTFNLIRRPIILALLGELLVLFGLEVADEVVDHKLKKWSKKNSSYNKGDSLQERVDRLERALDPFCGRRCRIYHGTLRGSSFHDHGYVDVSSFSVTFSYGTVSLRDNGTTLYTFHLNDLDRGYLSTDGHAKVIINCHSENTDYCIEML